MNLSAHIGSFSRWDLCAVLSLFVLWGVLIRLIEHPPRRRPSVAVLMAGMRREWMVTFVTRNPRIFDGNVIDSLRQSTAFFASASMIALGAGVALLGDSARLSGFAENFVPDATRAQLELKLVLMIVLIANAFLKFVWANRLFGYCSVMMASVPNEADNPMAFPRAAQAAEINISAARSYNRGLESVYFAIASLAWLIGPEALTLAVAVTGAVIARREFASNSRRAILAARDQCLR